MRFGIVALSILVLAGCASTPEPKPVPVRIGLALGGGAARGFAHVGVIKALETQGIFPDIIVGTSAGAVVGSLYASGYTGFELQRVALDMNEKQVTGWAWPNRGWMDGEPLQNYINKAVGNRPIDALPRRLGVVAVDLKSGEPILFGSGNTGVAVRASAAVPGVFQPVAISGREYIDGGAVSPVPARFARQMGATFVIAVDISQRPDDAATDTTVDVLLQTFTIMGRTISQYETADADVVIRPLTTGLPSTDLSGRHRAILEGEKAVALVMPQIKEKLDRARNGGARK